MGNYTTVNTIFKNKTRKDQYSAQRTYAIHLTISIYVEPSTVASSASLLSDIILNPSGPHFLSIQVHRLII